MSAETVPRPAWAAWGQGQAAVRSVALATSRWAPSVSVSLLPAGHRHRAVPCLPRTENGWGHMDRAGEGRVECCLECLDVSEMGVRAAVCGTLAVGA